MDGNVKAIELQGIVRNRTKIGVEDGQAEDLLNLRFVDGSWRTSGDGRKVYVMSDNANGYHYTQLYIHTNVYRHLLGVRDGKLWWFADIESDGVTFAPKSTPEELTAVTGDMWITQTGHLLTVIDEADNFDYFVFKTGDETYKKVMVDENGKQSDRGLYPFGQVHFNCYCPADEEHKITIEQGVEFEYIYQAISYLIEQAHKRNKFSQSLLALIALELYDGSYVLTSPPQYICFRERMNRLASENKEYLLNIGNLDLSLDIKCGIIFDKSNLITAPSGTNGVTIGAKMAVVDVKIDPNGNVTTSPNAIIINKDTFPFFSATINSANQGYTKLETQCYSSDLIVNISDNILQIVDNDLYKSLCIFVTDEVAIYPPAESDDFVIEDYIKTLDPLSVQLNLTRSDGNNITLYYNCPQDFKLNYVRKSSKIIYDLLRNPFYLLRKYDKYNIKELIENPIINLSAEEYDGLLSNITQQPTLPTESFSRETYLPKYTYLYNGRLHIANYKSEQFHGYPLDLFHLHNHSLKVDSGSYFKGVLENLVDNDDAYMQYEKKDYTFPILSQSDDINMYKEQNIVFAFAKVDVNTSDGVQKVVRYIEPYITIPAQQGRADFIESLNPILTFPDYRATFMQICILAINSSNVPVFYEKTFTLKPHPLYNMAYYIDPDLKPISIGPSNREVELPTELNTTEFFPNGLKVSKTDNPMFFPVENTYQIGSGEILAMCSNSIAVGTGQTGAAPLYVFCSDGIYALFVDSSGEMTYTNARVIARDVLNNPRSVTPIDAGVAFTTDRGLMLIAGEQVQEIGNPAEGDVLRYTDDHSADFIKIAEGAFTKVADFPNTLCDKTDFLTYLTGAIVNYNHNERELMISNPEKDYSYILDRNGNWSRRDYSADEYIQNYPTSYRLRDGEFYKVDEEGDNDTILEKRKEADNKFFYLSNVIKLDSIGFKQAARFALRGYFDTKREVVHEYSDVCVSNGYFDIVLDYKTKIKPRTHYRMTFENQYALTGTDLSISYGSRATNGDIYVSKTGEHKIPDSPDYAPIELNIYTSAFDHGKDVDALVVRLFNNGNTSSICKGKITFQEMNDDFSTEQNDYIGCYIFGSYDGRKWAMLGGNEKQGKFTDIGCKIERTDVKFFRICLSGKLRGESRIDYMEISSEPSILNGKIR